jgi:hypothetical protein
MLLEPGFTVKGMGDPDSFCCVDGTHAGQQKPCKRASVIHAVTMFILSELTVQGVWTILV